MGALWDQVVKFVQPADGAPERQGALAPLAATASPPARYSPTASLETIGMQNETLRAQIEEVGE